MDCLQNNHCFVLQMRQQLPNMEFGRRIAIEKDLERSDAYRLCNIGLISHFCFICYLILIAIFII